MLGEEDLNPLGFHRIAPGRRVSSMMAPTIVLRDGEIELGLGSAGSNRIRSAILQTIVRVVEQGMGAGEAVGAPRLHFEQGVVQAEPGIDEGALARLEARGHTCRPAARDQPILRRRAGRRTRSRHRSAQRRRGPAPRRRGGDRVMRLRGRGPARRVSRARRARRGWRCSRSSRPTAPRWRNCSDAVAAGRLTLLPVERALAGDGPALHGARGRRDGGARPRAACSASAPRSASPTATRTNARVTDAGRRGRAADEGLPRRRPARGRDAAGGEDDRDGDVADRRGQPRDHRQDADAAGRHRARPRPALRGRRRVHAAPGRPDPALRASRPTCSNRSAAT